MLSKTHDAIAFASLLSATVYIAPADLKIATIIVALIANIVGATLPDLDQAGNRLWDLLPGGNLVGKTLRHLFLGHRTLSHSLLGLFLVWKACFWLIPRLFNSTFLNPVIIIYSLLIGYISHLIADALTEEGIPLLFPLKLKFGFPPLRALRLKTGHWVEKFIVFPTVVIYTLWLAATHWLQLIKI